jgi:SAM-dependent methyltransferase
VCNAGLRFFLPFGIGGRLRTGALCPQCGSLERDRAAWLWLNDGPDRLRPGIRLLHVAPERCLESRLRERVGGGYLTGDLLREDVDRRLSIEELPFEDRSYDAVICNHVLEHVADDRKAMREILRVLRPGGWALLQVPINRRRPYTIEDPTASALERRLRFGQHDHVRSYGAEYTERLKAAGFELDSSSVDDRYNRDEVWRYGLDPDEVLHICRRR